MIESRVWFAVVIATVALMGCDSTDSGGTAGSDGDRGTGGAGATDGGTGGASGMGGAAGTGGSAGTGGAAGVGGGLGGTGGAAGTGGTGGTSGSGGTTLRCGGTDTCVADPGPAWTGPVALASSALGCTEGFPDEAETLLDGIQPSASACACTCGSATAICSTFMRVTGYQFDACVNAQGQVTVTENQCYNKDFSASLSLSLASASTSCGPGTVTAGLPAPTWSTTVRACDGFTPGAGACDPGQTCVPRPGDAFEAALCYLQDGSHACPSGFPNKTLYYTGFTDSRTCPSTCTCQGSGASCMVDVEQHGFVECFMHNASVTVFSGQDTCVTNNPENVGSIIPRDVTVDSNGFCSPPTLSVSGGVSPTDATTLCCN